MSSNELKQRIHTAVDSITDTEHLIAILSAATVSSQDDQEQLTAEELNILEERRAAYIRGEAELIPWRESIARAKAKHGL